MSTRTAEESCDVQVVLEEGIRQLVRQLVLNLHCHAVLLLKQLALLRKRVAGVCEVDLHMRGERTHREHRESTERTQREHRDNRDDRRGIEEAQR